MNILFMGRKRSAAQALEWTLAQGHSVVAVVTDNHMGGSKTAAVAEAHNLCLCSLEDVYRRISSQELEIDLAISFVFWRKIKPPLLDYPKLGIINFHPAPLPDYKGTAGYNLAILEGLDAWSVSAHYIDAGIDTGSIIDQFTFSIDPEEETVVSLEQKSQEFMLALYRKTIRRVARDGILPATSNKGGRYVPRKEMESMKAIKPGDDVDRKIRAFWFPPYTGAYVEINGKRYTLVNDHILRSLAPAEQGPINSFPGAIA